MKITKAKLVELRTSLLERDEPISNAAINTLFASLSAAFSYFIEQGWCQLAARTVARVEPIAVHEARRRLAGVGGDRGEELPLLECTVGVVA